MAQEGRIAARGVSAGGLLMGAVTTMRPELWAAVVAEVPFVDAINTMLDPSIPLTVGEWEEWGDPSIPDQYAVAEGATAPTSTPSCRLSRHPGHGRFQRPPGRLLGARQVGRPAPHRQPGQQTDSLKTEMGAGHGGPSGRYDAWHDEAFVLAFVLDQLDLA